MSATTAAPARRRNRKGSRAAFGSVRQLPSGRWQARYTDARDVRHTAPQPFATKRQAEDWLATTRADMVRGSWRAPELGVITLAEYAADHLARRQDLAPKTRETYADALSNWLDLPLEMPTAPGRRARAIHLGAQELRAISVADVRDWHSAALHASQARATDRAERHRQHRVNQLTVHAARAWALANGVKVSSTGRLPRRVLDAWQEAASPSAPVPPHLIAPQTPDASAGRAVVAQAYRFLRTVLGVAVEEGRITTNPCTVKGAGNLRSRDRVPATPADVVAMAAAMPPRLAAAVPLAAWSGLRAGELFGLARRHIDLADGSVRVERQAVLNLAGTPPYLGPTKTESSLRTVWLPDHVVEALRDHMTAYTDPEPDALVFTDDAGRIVAKSARNQAFRRARLVAGRPDLRWHDLRHTGATWAARQGATMAELKRRFGHSTDRAAMLYQQASDQRDRDLAGRLSQLGDAASNVRAITSAGQVSA